MIALPRHTVAWVCMLVLFCTGVASSRDSGNPKTVTDGGTILAPLAAKSGMPYAAAMFVQETGIDASAYEPLARQLQLTAPFYLWIAILDFPQDTPSSELIDSYASSMLQELDVHGFNKSDTRMLYAFGHGSGGFALQDWGIDYVANQRKTKPLAAPLRGVVLLGSYLQRRLRNITYPTGVLTLAGDMDGVTRITRIAESFYHLVLHPTHGPINFGFPHIVLAGVSHMQFASGSPPPIAQELDLKPEQSDHNATIAIASISASFMALKFDEQLSDGTSALDAPGKDLYRRLANKAEQRLGEMVGGTNDMLMPIVESFESEAFYHLHLPCYDKHPDANCSSRSPWVETAQALMCTGLSALGASVSDQDILWPVNEIFPHDYLPEIRNKCDKPLHCALNTTSVAQNVYSKIDEADESLTPIAAQQQEVKFNSRQRCFEHAGLQHVDFNTTDGGSLCAFVNGQAYERAVAAAYAVNRLRFQKTGQAMRMADDKVTAIFPVWSLEPLTIDTTGSEAIVTAWASKYDTSNPIPLVAGLHFCKLLSPARAMEWVYVDGLRKLNSLTPP